MKQRLLALVVCPLCGDDLRCDPDDVDRADAEEIMEAELSCARGHRYPVINGVPRLLAPELLADTLRQFHAQHFRRYRAYWENTPSAKSSTEGRTLRSFSYQWNVFSEMYAHWEENFRSYFEPLVKRDDFAGKLVLDAGCGFGRHAFYAAKFGAEVLAMDLSEAVEAAYENTRSLDNVHVVQADLYRAPLRPIFDLIYCVGVIQHLSRPAEGFGRLASLLRETGGLFVWVYGKRQGFYRGVDLLRLVSTRLSLRWLYGITFFLNLASFLCFSLPYRILRSVPLARRLADVWPFTRYANLPMRVGHADWFDRLSVPSTVYFSREQVEDWYAETDLSDVEIQSRDGIGWRALGKAKVNR